MFQGPQRKVDVLELTDCDMSKESNFYESKKVKTKKKNVFTVLVFKTVEYVRYVNLNCKLLYSLMVKDRDVKLIYIMGHMQPTLILSEPGPWHFPFYHCKGLSNCTNTICIYYSFCLFLIPPVKNIRSYRPHIIPIEHIAFSLQAYFCLQK